MPRPPTREVHAVVVRRRSVNPVGPVGPRALLSFLRSSATTLRLDHVVTDAGPCVANASRMRLFLTPRGCTRDRERRIRGPRDTQLRRLRATDVTIVRVSFFIFSLHQDFLSWSRTRRSPVRTSAVLSFIKKCRNNNNTNVITNESGLLLTGDKRSSGHS